jgi:hypothetical protein
MLIRQLTGRRRGRIGWFGKIILQVELRYNDGIDIYFEWRDAKLEDFSKNLHSKYIYIKAENALLKNP